MRPAFLELRTAPDSEDPAPGWTKAQFDSALEDLKRLKGIMWWRKVRLVLENPYAAPNPLKTYLALLLMAPRSAELVARDGSASIRIGATSVFNAAMQSVDGGRLLRRSIADTIKALDAEPLRSPAFAKAATAAPFYLRTNLWFGARVGGSYSHAAGMLNAMRMVFGAVDFATTDEVPGLEPTITPRRIDLGAIKGWQCGVGVQFTSNPALLAAADRYCPTAPAFVYQRGGLADLSGLRIARRRQRPFVLEYNGPEVWVARNWGGGIPYAEEFEYLETGLLRRADVVSCVSAALVDDVVARGVDRERVHCSPNAVDPERFRPDIDGAAIRASLGLGARKAAVLLSSFGPWHGVDLAVEAYARLLRDRPHLAASTALVLAGDGAGRTAAREQSRACGLVEGQTVFFPGVIKATEAAALLSAGEVLLSPTRRNPDGSAFFGSPTKLFEYMATGRTIIASDLDQLGEILTHGETALLVSPDDAFSLASALAVALDDPASCSRLGPAARRAAVEGHTWIARVNALAARLKDLDLLSR